MTDYLNGELIKDYFGRIDQSVELNQDLVVMGTAKRISGMKIEAVGLSASLGTLCNIVISENKMVSAEVVGFSGATTYLMANEDVHGLKQGSKVIPVAKAQSVSVGMALLGRIIDAEGKPIDNEGPIYTDEHYSLIAKPLNPLKRKRIDTPLDVGIRAINGLLTVGKGQRIGIFAGSGVGKSVLLGMMTRFTKANVVVVGLIGERGREVKEFIEENLGEHGLAKTVVVAAPADTSPLMRVNGASMAMTIAEYYRDKGLDVLLIIDSLTRCAQAQREISLSVGEPPATKGFTPSVFTKISKLVERSGNGATNKGSITAFYTVLVEGDDHADPIADHARSVLDGHICLSRDLADAGHYPAINIEQSISRLMTTVASKKQVDAANHFKKIYGAYMHNRDLINVGMYQSGADKAVDEALQRKDVMDKFLVQSVNEFSSMEDSVAGLLKIFATQ